MINVKEKNDKLARRHKKIRSVISGTEKKPRLNVSFFIEKLKFSWPFALSMLFTNIFFNFDKIFISLIKNDYQLGLYAVSVTFVSFLITIISVFAIVFFNLFSKYSFKEQVVPIFNKFLKLAMLISFPIFFGGLLLSKEIITLVFGVEFILGAASFSLLLFFFLLMSINIVFSHYLFAHNLEKYMLKVRGISTGVNIVLNILFIPFFGIVGAAITTIFSELINFFFVYRRVKQNISFVFFSPLLRIFASSIIMLFFIYIFKYFIKIRFFNNSFDVLFIIGICGLLYLVCLFIFKVISIKEIKETISSFRS
ncbi:hypothetical protein EOM09_06840 [bacterium]|nr:hypothetical protein [bacterium]